MHKLEIFSLKNDYAFKRFFTTSPGLLVVLLNAILAETSHEPVESLEILNPLLSGETIGDKRPELDIAVRDDKGRVFNIEMQRSPDSGYEERVLLYLFRLFASILRRGENYVNITGAFSINILDFKLNPEDDFDNSFRFKNDNFPFRTITSKVRLFFFELKKGPKVIKELIKPRDQWLFYIRFAHLLERNEMEQLEKMNPVFVKANAVLEEISMDPQSRLAYHKRRDRILFQRAGIRKMRRDMKAEGEAIGEERGKIEGKREGKREANLKIATLLIEKGAELDYIHKLTGVSLEEIKDLQNQKQQS